MSDLSGLVSIKDIVKETVWLAEKGEGKYNRFLQLAINGYRELNKQYYKNTKRVKLTMDSNYIIPFPSDMVMAVNIFVPVDGTFKRLSKKEDLVDTTSLSGGNVVRNTDDGEGQDIKVNNFGMGMGTTNLFGYYTEDKRNARFIFLTNYRTEVILDYVTNGITSGDDNIPTLCKQALQSWIMWQDSYYSKDYNLGEKQLYEREWDKQSRLLQAMQTQTLDEMSDAFNAMATQMISR